MRALVKIQNTFTGAKWFVEGDIQACFDSFDHHVLIDLPENPRTFLLFLCTQRVPKLIVFGLVMEDSACHMLKNGKRQRVYYGVVQLRMPHEKWAAKLLELGAIRISKDKSGKERWTSGWQDC